MIRLYVLVEGPTEEAFVNDVLGPHLGPSVTTIPIIVTSRRERSGKKRKGGGHWKHWGKDLRTLTRGNPGDDVRFTTLFDLYGLPSDFPEIERHAHEKNTLLRAIALEKAMADVVGDWRLIPYLQRHEFEALVLASLDKLSDLLDPQDREGLVRLRDELRRFSGPEDVNDGEDTAPSKRLEAAIPSYEKITHGPLAIEATGLAAIRERCPRFDSWLRRLEALRSDESGEEDEA